MADGGDGCGQLVMNGHGNKLGKAEISKTIFV